VLTATRHSEVTNRKFPKLFYQGNADQQQATPTNNTKKQKNIIFPLKFPSDFSQMCVLFFKFKKEFIWKEVKT